MFGVESEPRGESGRDCRQGPHSRYTRHVRTAAVGKALRVHATGRLFGKRRPAAAVVPRRRLSRLVLPRRGGGGLLRAGRAVALLDVDGRRPCFGLLLAGPLREVLPALDLDAAALGARHPGPGPAGPPAG